MGRFRFTVRRGSLRELYKAIQEHERRGCECVAPYKKIKKTSVQYNHDSENAKRFNYVGVNEQYIFLVVMQRVGDSNEDRYETN